jgi:dienelactone hydrolase
MRGIDVLSARPEIDPARIAMVGLSYGGFYTLVTTAMDPRIKVAVCSGYFGIQEGRYAKDDLSIASDLEFAGRFTRFRDPDLIALICPRPLQIQAGLDDDPLHRTAGEQFAPLAAAWYERLGLGALFEHRMFAGGHEFNDALAWAFVQNHLQEEAP